MTVALLSPRLGLPPHDPPGSHAAALEIRVLRERHEVERRALLDTGVTGPAIDEQRLEHQAQIAPLLDTLAGLHRRQDRALSSGAIVWSCLGLFLARWAGRRRRRPVPPLFTEAASAVVIGAAAILLLAGPVSIALTRAGLDLRAAGACGLAVAAGSAIAPSPIRWRPGIARDRRIVLCADCMFTLAILGLSAVLGRGGAWALALGASAMLGGVASRLAPPSARGRARARALVLAVIVPGAAALSAARIVELELSITLLALAGAAVFGDLLTLGAYLGIRACGPTAWQRQPLRHALEIMSTGIGPTMVLAAPVLIASSAIDPASGLGGAWVLAMLAGAILSESMIPRVRGAWKK